MNQFDHLIIFFISHLLLEMKNITWLQKLYTVNSTQLVTNFEMHPLNTCFFQSCYIIYLCTIILQLCFSYIFKKIDSLLFLFNLDLLFTLLQLFALWIYSNLQFVESSFYIQQSLALVLFLLFFLFPYV